MWIDRTSGDKLEKLLATRPVVLLTGARQTGKSSLLQKKFSKARYVTFDHLREVEAAKASPQKFLSQFNEQVILDEIQYVPELFRELKIVVDKERDNYGKWILTGSQRFELMETISESLAGRISINNLETLSALELRNSNHPLLDEYLWKGGYPELWGNVNIDCADYFESYLRTYAERDLKQIVDVKNLNDFRRLIRALATRIGQLINYRDLSNDIGVSDVTIKSWVHALKMSGLVYLLPPFFSNIGKRLVKSPKLYFSDHGLACHLLGIDNLEKWNAHVHIGNLWENFVMMELVKTQALVPGNDLFFYRDQNGVEIDFIIEKGRTLWLIEAKVSERVDVRKLNFKKVVPVLEGKYDVKTVLAHNISHDNLSQLKGHLSYNPLRYSLATQNG